MPLGFGRQSIACSMEVIYIRSDGKAVFVPYILVTPLRFWDPFQFAKPLAVSNRVFP